MSTVCPMPHTHCLCHRVDTGSGSLCVCEAGLGSTAALEASRFFPGDTGNEEDDAVLLSYFDNSRNFTRISPSHKTLTAFL